MVFPLTTTSSISAGTEMPKSFLAETRKSYFPSARVDVLISVSAVEPTCTHFGASGDRFSTRYSVTGELPSFSGLFQARATPFGDASTTCRFRGEDGAAECQKNLLTLKTFLFNHVHTLVFYYLHRLLEWSRRWACLAFSCLIYCGDLSFVLLAR